MFDIIESFLYNDKHSFIADNTCGGREERQENNERHYRREAANRP